MLKPIGYFLSIAFFLSCQTSKEHRLFNGESLEGWEGSAEFFRVEQGAIIGGSLEKAVDKSYYLCTKKKYENFELKLDAKFNTSYLLRLE